MRIAIAFGEWCLSFRRTITFDNLWQDPRGLTGSEVAFVRIAQELKSAGHSVELFTVSPDLEWEGMPIRPIGELSGSQGFDATIAINEPDLLRGASGYRVCAFFLNDVSFCKVGFDEHVDLFCSPSWPHMMQMRDNAAWHKVETGPEFPDGKAQYTPDPSKWEVVSLGCDPERYPAVQKIPGRVIYCSSPDRGLHWLLQEWPAIKRAVPHASLHIFYRLEPWLRGFDGTPYFPPIEPLRARANYVEECLRRFKEHGGLDVTLRDSVSRETIEREMAQAEVQAYPCDTTTWSEGFSCSILECCAARACPIITDCDALATVYSDLQPTEMMKGKEPVGNWVPFWRDRVIRALQDEKYRDELNAKAGALADRLTWRRTAQRIAELIEERRP